MNDREEMIDLTGTTLDLVRSLAPPRQRPDSIRLFASYTDRLLTLAETSINGVAVTLVRDDFSGKILLRLKPCSES